MGTYPFDMLFKALLLDKQGNNASYKDSYVSIHDE